MLIGFSISRCISDLIEQKVNQDVVLLIIGRTDFDLNQLDLLIDGYQRHRGEWYDYDRSSLKDLITRLYVDGKIHQPRQFGHHPRSVPTGKHWMRVVYEPQDLGDAAQQAWDRYVLLASLTK